tara:strand:+ start:134 stop:706 length:573 start_codon:yes stop_codon:yes gene_type:complete
MLLLLSLFAASTVATPLTPRVFTPLPVGSVTPKGWLLKQLTLQAEGLSGHLAQFWNDVMNSIWIGGAGDGGLHERTPYWLNGVVPLAFLLKNANVKLDPVVGIYKAPWGPAPYHGCLSGDGCKTVPTPQPVDMMAQVDKYISYILAQNPDVERDMLLARHVTGVVEHFYEHDHTPQHPTTPIHGSDEFGI